MKKYVLTPVNPNHEDTMSELQTSLPKPPTYQEPRYTFPTTKKGELIDRIHRIEEEVHRTLADPKMSTTEKLLRHGALLASYKQTHEKLNQPRAIPPIGNDAIAPLPKEEEEETQSEVEPGAWGNFMSGFFHSPEFKRLAEEREENAQEIMAKIMTPPSQDQKWKSPYSMLSSPYESVSSQRSTPKAPFSNRPSPAFGGEPYATSPLSPSLMTPQNTPKPVPLKTFRQQTLASVREKRGAKPVNRLTYVAPGMQGFGKGHKMRIRYL